MQAAASPAAVAAAMAACEKAKAHRGEMTPDGMAALNAAVELVLSGSAEVAKAYCEAVWHIVNNAGADEENRITAGVPTVALLLTAMTSHVDCEDVQAKGAWAKGAWALACLAIGNPVNIAGLLSLGGPAVLYTAADTHITSAWVQFRVCEALDWIAAYSADGRAVLRGGRAAEVATRAKASHPDHGSVTYYADRLLRKLSKV